MDVDARPPHDQRPRVDVVVVTHGTAELTPELLRRLVDEHPDVDLRLLVHDNASPDSTAERIAEVVPEAEIERHPANLGFAGGVNAALARSSAPWVLLLNSDASPRPGSISALVRAAVAQPAAAAAVPRLERPDGSVEHSTHPFPSLTVAAMTAVDAHRWAPRWAERHLLVGAWQHDRARWVDWAVGAAWLVPREALDDIGPLDDRFFMYAEDLEWCWRAADAGRRIRFEPSAVFEHVGGASAARRYDDHRRTLTHLGNTYVLLERRWPRWKVLAYRGLQVVGSGRLHLAARVRRDPVAAHWRAHVAAHLGRRAAETPAAGRR